MFLVHWRVQLILQWQLSRHNALVLEMLWGISGRAAELLKLSCQFSSLGHTASTAPVPSPLNCSLSATSSHPHFLDTPSPNCSHYKRLMSGAACASRCPWGARKRAWMSVFSLLNAGDWSLDRLVRSVASTAVLTSHSPACSCTFLHNRLDMRTS